jgi:hypothetical protein
MADIGMSNYLANKLLNNVFNGGAWSPPATVYVSLHTAALNAAGVGTEVSGGSYARQAITANTTNFPTTTTREIKNAVAFNFPVAAAPWGTVIYFGVWDALSGGNLIWYGEVDPNKTIGTGDALSIPIDLLIFQLNDTTV